MTEEKFLEAAKQGLPFKLNTSCKAHVLYESKEVRRAMSYIDHYTFKESVCAIFVQQYNAISFVHNHVLNTLVYMQDDDEIKLYAEDVELADSKPEDKNIDSIL